MKRGKFIVISGPSGVGKGTICNKLINEINAKYSVSLTTRSPRENEIDGINYYFVSNQEFLKKIDDNELLEYNYYNGNYYGTSKMVVNEMIEKGINVLAEIDVTGGYNIKNIYPDAILIYIKPPSYDELRNRLINRGTDNIDSINERLKIAIDEEKKSSGYDYVIVNDDVDKATNDIKNIILNM